MPLFFFEEYKIIIFYKKKASHGRLLFLFLRYTAYTGLPSTDTPNYTHTHLSLFLSFSVQISFPSEASLVGFGYACFQFQPYNCLPFHSSPLFDLAYLTCSLQNKTKQEKTHSLNPNPLPLPPSSLSSPSPSLPTLISDTIPPR